LVEPLRPIVDTSVATTKAAIVARRRRSGVTNDHPRVCNQARSPLAPAIADIAQPAHMARTLSEIESQLC
jgi:hypothetical protein